MGYGLTYAFSVIIATPGLNPSALLGSFTVSPDSLFLAYVVGFLLSLATVVVASRRASRLNIVRAVRDLPEPLPTRRTYTWAAGIGGLAIVLGALLYAATRAGDGATLGPDPWRDARDRRRWPRRRAVHPEPDRLLRHGSRPPLLGRSSRCTSRSSGRAMGAGCTACSSRASSSS